MTSDLPMGFIVTVVPRERGVVTFRQNLSPQRPGDKELTRVYSISQTLSQHQGTWTQNSLDLKVLYIYRHDPLHQRRGQERGDMHGGQMRTPTKGISIL